MNSIKTIAAITVTYSLCSLPGLAVADDKGPDSFKISLGAYAVGRYESSMSLTEKSLGVGVSISPNDTLGLDLKQTVTRLDGYYRFTPEHALTYSWYSINSSGNKRINEDFDWIDENGQTIIISAGASVNSELEYDIVKAGYLWSFYHNDKVELSVGGGLHFTRIGVELSADSTVPPASEARDVKSTVPLPVLSFGLNYAVTQRLSWYLRSELFAISIDDWSGTYTDNTLGMEYRAWRNVGLGAGLGSNALKVKEETDDHTFLYENRITGINLYVAAYF